MCLIRLAFSVESDIRWPCQICVQKLILSYTSTTPHPTDANRRYSKKYSMFAGQRSLGLRQLDTVWCNYQEHNEAPDSAEHPGTRCHQSTASRHHITPTLEWLHCLPITSHINFKIASLTLKVHLTNQPAYLALLISSYHPVPSLRSADHNCLTVLCQNCCRRQNFQRCCSADLDGTPSHTMVWDGVPSSTPSQTILHQSILPQTTSHYHSSPCMHFHEPSLISSTLTHHCTQFHTTLHHPIQSCISHTILHHPIQPCTMLYYPIPQHIIPHHYGAFRASWHHSTLPWTTPHHPHHSELPHTIPNHPEPDHQVPPYTFPHYSIPSHTTQHNSEPSDTILHHPASSNNFVHHHTILLHSAPSRTILHHPATFRTIIHHSASSINIWHHQAYPSFFDAAPSRTIVNLLTPIRAIQQISYHHIPFCVNALLSASILSILHHSAPFWTIHHNHTLLCSIPHSPKQFCYIRKILQ